MSKLTDILVVEEGFRGNIYVDTEGFETIGIGTKLPISKEEGILLLEFRLNKIKRDVDEALAHLQIEDDAWDVLYLMAYQLGVGGLLKFQKMINALERQDYKTASKEMLLSKWAKQTPNRANRMAEMMKEV